MKDKSITELIKAAIADTALRFGDKGIVSAETMIPHMRTKLREDEYPKRYKSDIKYAESDAARLDIYYPEEGEGPFPVFVEVHGGAWYFGQRSSIEFAPFLQGLNRGYACVSLGYTLSPEAVYPQAVVEIKRAIDYLKKNSTELRLDADRIALWGGSAGAQLAALAALSRDTGYLEKESGGADSSVDVLVLWYGCYNYYLGKRLDEWVYRNFFGGAVDEVREALLMSNPACHVTANAPYTLLQHGLADMVVPYSQSVYMYDVIKDISGADRCTLELREGCDHADVKLFAQDNIKRVFDYIDEKLGKHNG